MYSASNIDIVCADSLDGLGREVDCVITDPPYSERTHAGHDWSGGLKGHHALNYTYWTPETVARAVRAWHPSCRGWFVVLTDHLLAPHWADELERAGRYVFAPVPFVSPGSRVRLSGDGPSSWTCWIVVARPRCKPYSTWGTLPGAYIVKPERMPIVGGKPLTLMKALVRDYSRRGDVVCDPCCGAGTTLVAAKELGRRGYGLDINAEHCQLAIGRLKQEVLPL